MKRHHIRDFGSLAILLILVGVALYFFRDNENDGMQFDEVYRLNNIFPYTNEDAEPYDQSILNFEIWDLKFPVMYKAYVSSLGIARLIPVILFEDKVAGLRILAIIYFVIPIFFYHLFLKYNPSLFERNLPSYGIFYLALYAPILVAVSPVFFPEVRFNFATSTYILYFCSSAWLLRLFAETKNHWLLFLAQLITGLGINIEFYYVWVVSCVILSFTLFYPKLFLKLLSLKSIAVTLIGLSVGAANIVYFNIATAGASITPFFDRLLNREKYNNQAIDFKAAGNFSDEIVQKLTIFTNFYDLNAWLYILVSLAMAATVIAFFTRKKTSKETAWKLCGFTIFNWSATVLCILLSPNTTRAGHYTYSVLAFSIMLVVCILTLTALLPKSIKRIATHGTLLALVTVFSASTATDVRRQLRDGGTGFFSPAIFELHDYLEAKAIKDEDILFIQWGSASQLYFMNNGEFKTNSLTFRILSNPTDFNRLLQTELNDLFINGKDTVFIPIHVGVRHTGGINVYDLLISFLSKSNYEYNSVTTFGRRSDSNIREIELISVSNKTRVDSPSDYKLRFFNDYDESRLSDSYGWGNFTYDYALGSYAQGTTKPNWVNSYSTYLFKKVNAAVIQAKLWIPDLSGYRSSPSLKISVNNRVIHDAMINNSGTLEIRKLLPSELISSEIFEVEIQLSPSYEPGNNDKRDLAAILEGISIE